jgi:phosphoenolpyruvate synthase/pyruvate phosphate dikinase
MRRSKIYCTASYSKDVQGIICGQVQEHSFGSNRLRQTTEKLSRQQVSLSLFNIYLYFIKYTISIA